jgi:hypothetical protein
MKQDNAFAVKLVEQMSAHTTYDISEQKIQRLAEKYSEYEFMGIRTLDGESRVVNGFMEFHSDPESVWKVVLSLFYKPQSN